MPVRFSLKKHRIIFFCILCSFQGFSQDEKIISLSVFHGGNDHNGVYQSNGYNNFGDIKWTFTTNGKIFSSPALSKHVIYIGSGDSSLYAINEETGKLKWKFKTRAGIYSTCAVYKDMVFFESYDGFFYALHATTGNLLWKFKTGGEKKVGAIGLWTMQPTDMYMEDLYDFFLSSPAIDTAGKDPVVYFGSSDGNVYALRASGGKLLWKFSTHGLIHSSPALANGTVYIGSWDTYLYALDAHTGQLKWKFKTGDQPVYHQLEGIEASPLYYKGKIYLGARDGYFYSLNANTGELIWKYSANGSWVITTAAARHDTVYFGTSDSYLFIAVDAETGKELYHLKTNGYVYSSPVIAGNTAFFGDFTGKMNAVDINTSGQSSHSFSTAGRRQFANKILKEGNIDFDYVAAGANDTLYSTGVKVMDILYKLGPIISSPVISNGAIYFGSSDGRLYAVNLK